MLDQHHPSTYYGLLYLGAKRYIQKYPRLLRLVRLVRVIGRLGPWRNLIIGYVKRHSSNHPLRTTESSLFPDLDIDQPVDQILRLGYSLGLSLPENYVDNLLEYYKDKDFMRCDNPHKDCDFVNRIVFDPKIVEIVRRYFGVEPVVYESSIYWSLPSYESEGIHREFHYDVGDFLSLTLLMYLTDVDGDCGPHVLIQNTRTKNFKQLLSPSMSYEMAISKYGDRIKIITGRRGTIILEDLTTYHQRAFGKKPRLALLVSYMFHRQPE